MSHIVLCPICMGLTTATGAGTRTDPEIVSAHRATKDGPWCIADPTPSRDVLIKAGRPVNND